MSNYSRNHKLTALRSKGGIMFFTIQRQDRLYKGTILLSPIENCCQKRAVYIREYRYKYGVSEA